MTAMGNKIARAILCEVYECIDEYLNHNVSVDSSIYGVIKAMERYAEQSQPKLQRVSDGLPEVVNDEYNKDCFIQHADESISYGYYDFDQQDWFDYNTGYWASDVTAWAYITKPEPLK